jgi:DNA (cytosine-5)-methyltransferase 1
MKHGSLFSGIGGFDLAAEWMGWENVFHCEWNEFGQKVLHHYWPQAIQYNDITKTDFTIHRGAIDILTGGFPCQPYSAAGKRLGKDDERHLWPEMLRAIREIQPRWVVGENVRGLTNWNGGLVFDEVQSDLEALGYEVLPFLLPACAKDAPHRRDRIWFVAYRADARVEDLRGQKEQANEFEAAPHSTSDGLHDESTERNNTVGADNKQPRTQRVSPVKGFGNERTTTYADSANNKTRTQREILGQQDREKTSRYSNVERPNQWQNFPTQPPICGGNDGLPSELDGITFPKWRNESIKAYGNAVVPQVVYEIFKAIEAYQVGRDL